MGPILLSGLLAALAPALQDKPAENPLGPKVVQMRNADYYGSPGTAASRPTDPLGKALYGDKVTVTAIEGRGYAKVTRPKGGPAYIHKSALIAEEQFDPHPENEEEKQRINAQNYKAGRFDKTVEDNYIAEKGEKMKQAYKDVEGLMARYSKPRAELEKDLAAFRKAGKLGEFSTVK